jgi:hypothetical protein
MEVIFKFKIRSENINRNNRKLVLKIKMENSIADSEIRNRGEQMFGIARVEYYEIIADQSTNHIDWYFGIERNYFSSYELMIQTKKEKDILIMNIPEVISK